MSRSHNDQDEVIDLSESVSFTVESHALSNTIIEVFDSDDSSVGASQGEVKKKNKYKPEHLNKRKEPVPEKNEKSRNGLCCPVCRETLKNKPLVSTMCGHVFCEKCFRATLRIYGRCLICRKTVKGAWGYHKLYL